MKKSIIFLCVLILSYSVTAHAITGHERSLCLQQPWINMIDQQDWQYVKTLTSDRESQNIKLYTNDNNNKLITDVYNPIIEGTISLIKERDLYHSLFKYHIHSDTTGPINGPSVVISASYHIENKELVSYCYNIQKGQKNIAKIIADERLLSLFNIAHKLLLANDK